MQLLKAGMQLDLGGIAKGYAADEGLAVLKKHGVDAGPGGGGRRHRGERAAAGRRRLEDRHRPAAGRRRRRKGRSLVLHDAAVSTSGDAEQYVEIDGKRYSHIVDPKTGIGLVGRMSATVVAPHGVVADSQTKIVCRARPGEGVPILEKEDGVSGRFVRLRRRRQGGDGGDEDFPAADEPAAGEETVIRTRG